MRVLLLGGGGREHALGWKLAQSSLVREVVSAPGNPGLEEVGPTLPDLRIDCPEAVAEAATAFDLVVVGPEAPLAAGVADAVAEVGIAVFGPTQRAARLESSKTFAKETMRRAGVPTADSAAFVDPGAARSHLHGLPAPYVVKADGLAAGKGVVVTSDRDEALRWVDRCFAGDFGEAGSKVVIEDYLEGPEVSVFSICAGGEGVPLAAARDYKRLADRDAGPNTGGMGCFSPVPDAPPDLVEDVNRLIIEPVLGQLAAEGTPYVGFLYAGLVLTGEGPKVMEFNCRLGDPETQVVLPRMTSDLAAVLAAASQGESVDMEVSSSTEAAVDVVLASDGYPGRPTTGLPIDGVDDAGAIPGVLVFHGGTARSQGRLVTAGGRVLNVVGLGSDLAAARHRAYQAAEAIRFPGMQYRTDIAGGV